MVELTEAIPAYDYRRDLARYRQEINNAVALVLDSGRLILGPEVQAFEREFAASAGVKHAIGVASGTDALVLALRAIGVRSGDEVLTVANTAVPTVSAICAIGAIPRLVDIDPATLQMSTAALSNLVASTTRCILAVHLHGHPADMIEIERIAAQHSIPVISDCAQAHASAIGARSVGTFGEISCYSFYPTKNLGALGDGGMCVTNSDELAAKLIELRQYGFRGDRIAHSEGVCSRLDELQAAILRIRLRYLDAGQRERDAIAKRYLGGLADCDVRLPSHGSGITHAWHQFVIRTTRRDALCELLHRAKVGFGIHYPVPIHLMPAYAFLGYSRGALPATEQAAEEVLSLPIFPGLRDDEIDRVIAVVRAG